MNSAYIGVKEVRGQVPGTTGNGARTNSAINNSQNSGYVRVSEYYTVHCGAPGLRHQAPRAVGPVLQHTAAVPRRHLLASQLLYLLCQCSVISRTRKYKYGNYQIS